jgi:hypothetical protein
MVDEIAGGLLRLVWWVIYEILFYTLCYWVGWPVCKVFTLGKYPASGSRTYLGGKNDAGWFCSFVGLAVIVGLFFLFVFWGS